MCRKQDSAHICTMPEPHFHIPTLSSRVWRREGEWPVKVLLTIATLFVVIITDFCVFISRWKRYTFKSPLMTVCFPLYPVPKWLYGNACSHIFVEILNICNSITVWTDLALVAMHPTRLCLTFRLYLPVDVSYICKLICQVYHSLMTWSMSYHCPLKDMYQYGQIMTWYPLIHRASHSYLT